MTPGRKVLGSPAVIGTAAAIAGLLTGDTVTGLQPALQSCTVPWTADATTTTYTCAGSEPLISTGAAVGTRTIDAPTSPTPGGSDHLLLTSSLPTSGDNTFQGQTSTSSLTFSGVQRAGTTR